MVKKKKVYFAGIIHDPMFVGKVWKEIDSRARKGQKLGLETNPEEIQEFERIRQLQEKKPSIDFRNELWNYLAPFIHSMWERAGFEISREALIAEFESLSNDYEFFYELYKRGLEKGMEVVPLETRTSLQKIDILGKKAAGTGKLTPAISELQAYIAFPARERQMAKRIVKEKVDFAVVGNSHIGEVETQLRKLGIKTERIFDEKEKSIYYNEEFGKMVRERYWARRKHRQEIRGKWLRGEISQDEMKRQLSRTDLVVKRGDRIKRSIGRLISRIKNRRKRK